MNEEPQLIATGPNQDIEARVEIHNIWAVCTGLCIFMVCATVFLIHVLH